MRPVAIFSPSHPILICMRRVNVFNSSWLFEFTRIFNYSRVGNNVFHFWNADFLQVCIEMQVWSRVLFSQKIWFSLLLSLVESGLSSALIMLKRHLKRSRDLDALTTRREPSWSKPWPKTRDQRCRGE